MKKMFLIALMGILVAASASAQSYRDSRYERDRSGRINYGSTFLSKTAYIGFRIGPAFTSLRSEDDLVDETSSKTGLNVGIAAGLSLSSEQPLFLESGLYYTEKGAKLDAGGYDYRFSVNYLEIPIVFKYCYAFDEHTSIEPFLGGYFALGVSGKAKDYVLKESHSVYGSGSPVEFKHGDAGIRIGVGGSYDMFYAELLYDLGLANVCDNEYDSTHNGAFMLNFGVNF